MRRRRRFRQQRVFSQPDPNEATSGLVWRRASAVRHDEEAGQVGPGPRGPQVEQRQQPGQGTEESLPILVISYSRTQLNSTPWREKLKNVLYPTLATSELM